MMEFHSFKFVLVQEFSENDLLRRYYFSEAFCRLHEATRRCIWYSDECWFPWNGIKNCFNERYWGEENEDRRNEVPRCRKTENVWVAINGEGNLKYDVVYSGIQRAQTKKDLNHSFLRWSWTQMHSCKMEHQSILQVWFWSCTISNVKRGGLD